VLSDAGNAVAKQYGLGYTAAEAVTDTMRKLGISLEGVRRAGPQTLPAATTFIVGADGAICFAAPLAATAGTSGRTRSAPRSAPEA
jgi:hypothetical protein